MIDFAELTSEGKVRNLSGHEKGQAARKKYSLDQIDRGSGPAIVRVPTEIYAISSSFIQGMFAESLSTLGSVDKFFDRYRFDATAPIIRQIERGLAHARLGEQVQESEVA